MFKLNQLLRAANENGGDDGAPGGGEVTIEALQAQLAEATSAQESMQNKMRELLGEKKKEQNLRRDAETQARLEAEEKAKKAGDFEQLFKSSQQQAEEYKTQLANLQNGIANEKKGSVAMRLAAEMADGHNAEILSEFVSRRLKYTDDGIKVLDNNGDLTVSTLDQLKAEFTSNERFASLLKGSQASGGGAPGSGSASGGSEKVMTRSEFESAGPINQSKFLKSGGSVVD